MVLWKIARLYKEIYEVVNELTLCLDQTFEKFHPQLMDYTQIMNLLFFQTWRPV